MYGDFYKDGGRIDQDELPEDVVNRANLATFTPVS